MVLGGEHRVYQDLGQVLISHQPSLRSRLVKQRRQDFGFERVIPQRGHALERGDCGDSVVAKDQGRGAFRLDVGVKEGRGPGVNLEPVARYLVRADPGASFALRVARPSQPRSQRFRRCRLSDEDFRGRGKHRRGVVEDVAGQARVNQAREAHVVIDEDGGDGEEANQPDAEEHFSRRKAQARTPRWHPRARRISICRKCV